MSKTFAPGTVPHTYIHRVVGKSNGEIQCTPDSRVGIIRPLTLAIEKTNFSEYAKEVKEAQDYYLEITNPDRSLGDQEESTENVEEIETSNEEDPLKVLDAVRPIYRHEVLRIDQDTGLMRALTGGLPQGQGFDLEKDKVLSITIYSEQVQAVLEELDPGTRKDLETSIIPRLIQSYLNEPDVVGALTVDDVLEYLGFTHVSGETPAWLSTVVALIEEVDYFFINANPMKLYRSPEGSYELVYMGLQTRNDVGNNVNTAELAFVHVGATIKGLNEDNFLVLDAPWVEAELMGHHEQVKTGNYRRTIYEMQWMNIPVGD